MSGIVLNLMNIFRPNHFYLGIRGSISSNTNLLGQFETPWDSGPFLEWQGVLGCFLLATHVPETHKNRGFIASRRLKTPRLAAILNRRQVDRCRIPHVIILMNLAYSSGVVALKWMCWGEKSRLFSMKVVSMYM